MSKKIILLLFLQAVAFSVNAVGISFTSLDSSLDVNSPGEADQFRILGNNGEDISDVSPIPFNLGITPTSDVLITSTMNQRSGFNDANFSLELFSSTNTLILSLTRSDFLPVGSLGIFETVLGGLAPDAYEFRASGILDEQATSLTLRTSAVPLPTSVWLLGSALAGLVGISRRRKQAVTV